MEALSINVHDSYQERGRLDSSVGTNSPGEGTYRPSRLHSAGPQALPAGQRAARVLATGRPGEEPHCFQRGFCPC